MTICAYQSLYESSIAFGMRKAKSKTGFHSWALGETEHCTALLTHVLLPGIAS